MDAGSMATGWYAVERGAGGERRVGPLAWEELVMLVRSGAVQPADPVWNPALPEWVPAARVPGLVPVVPVPPVPPPAAYAPAVAPAGGYRPAVAGETVRGAINGARTSTGILSTRTYALVVTDRRLLCAETTADLLKAHAQEEHARRKAEGAGFLAQAWSTATSGSHFAQRYLAMDPMAILAETPGNFALTPAEVRALKVERKKDSDEDELLHYHLRITVETPARTIRFDTVDESTGHHEAADLFRSTFGAVVRT